MVLRRLMEDQGAGPAFANMLAQQEATLHAGLVVGLDAIGALVTIWTDLAGVRAREKQGRPCFLVSEALDALQDPSVPREEQPKDHLSTILAMIEGIEQGQFTPLAVFAQSDLGLYIVDGNKSAVACYEHARRHRRVEAVLPVIVPFLPAH
jgi:hypothetical protein